MPITVIDDAKAATLSEAWRGVARGRNDFVWVPIGACNGAGNVIDGQILRGFNGASGEIVRANALSLE